MSVGLGIVGPGRLSCAEASSPACNEVLERRDDSRMRRRWVSRHVAAETLVA